MNGQCTNRLTRIKFFPFLHSNHETDVHGVMEVILETFILVLNKLVAFSKYLFDCRVTGRERKREHLSSTGSFPECLQNAESSKAKARSPELRLGLPLGTLPCSAP